jgi:hypothetical protein
MVNSNSNEIQTIKVIIDGVEKEILEVYKIVNSQTIILFEAISSCFGLGFWRNEKGWLNKEGWRNNKK